MKYIIITAVLAALSLTIYAEEKTPLQNGEYLLITTGKLVINKPIRIRISADPKGEKTVISFIDKTFPNADLHQHGSGFHFATVLISSDDFSRDLVMPTLFAGDSDSDIKGGFYGYYSELAYGRNDMRRAPLIGNFLLYPIQEHKK
jgi:hypothetical protein